MPVAKTTPEQLRPFTFHGVELTEQGSDQAVGDCLLCGREGKLYVSMETGKWDCKVCQASGNAITFLRQLYDMSRAATQLDDYKELAEDRHVSANTLSAWGVARSVKTGDWIVPGYNADGKLTTLYRYVAAPGKKRVLMATPGLGLQPMGVQFYDASKPEAYVVEGVWNAMIMWETMAHIKEDEDGNLALTSSQDHSLLSTANILATPGCGSIGTPFERWADRLLADKEVVLVFDNDHPRINPANGQPVEPAGYAATKRAAQILAKGEQHPRSVSYVSWGKDGYDPTLPSGYDVRDAIAQGKTTRERLTHFVNLVKLMQPIPAEWASYGKKGAAKKGSVELKLLECRTWQALESQWRRAALWTEPLRRTLSMMMACAITTELVGDQVWLMVIGPPSCGKSMLCEALTVNKQFVFAKSTMRGFHSGFKTDATGEKDHSLVEESRNKTLITKDGDTLLQSPNKDQILSEARDIYDRVSRVHYRHGVSRDYEALNLTWILCGTGALRQLDKSELGERFLKVIMMEKMDADLEEDIAWRNANRAFQEMSMKSDGIPEKREGPEMVKAKQLTGGYLQYLRENATDLMSKVQAPEWALKRCMRLAQFVAFMRSRPSEKQQETADRELCFRLTNQLVRAATALAVVLNRPAIDTEVMRVVRQTALDTAHGRVLDLARALYAHGGENGLHLGTLARYTGHAEEEERKLLKHMKRIDIVEWFDPPSSTPGVRQQKRWRLTARLRRLYEEVMRDAQ